MWTRQDQRRPGSGYGCVWGPCGALRRGRTRARSRSRKLLYPSMSASIIETGRRLIEIRRRFEDEPGKWSMLIGRGDERPFLPFKKPHTYYLIAVANDARLVPHAGQLPPDSNALYHLSRLSLDRDVAKFCHIHCTVKLPCSTPSPKISSVC